MGTVGRGEVGSGGRREGEEGEKSELIIWLPKFQLEQILLHHYSILSFH